MVSLRQFEKTVIVQYIHIFSNDASDLSLRLSENTIREIFIRKNIHSYLNGSKKTRF